MNDAPVVPVVEKNARESKPIPMVKAAAKKSAKAVIKPSRRSGSPLRRKCNESSNEKIQPKSAADAIPVCTCFEDVEGGQVQHGDC